MKTISNELAAHLAGEVTTLAMCWKLTRRDDTVAGFTSHDRDIAFEGVTYRASTGFTPTAIAASAGLAIDNLEAEGMLSSDSLTETDIIAGKYDFAEIEVFMINYADTGQGIMTLRRGWLGEVSLYGYRFVAEVRGMAQLLAQNIGELYSPSCRASLGDQRCKIDLSAHTVTGTATAVNGRQEIRDTARTEPSGIFTLGTLTFTGGANAGIGMEVKEYSYAGGAAAAHIVFVLPLPHAIAPGDAYQLTKGCDKTAGTCKKRFANITNFRGEPHVPGLDRMLETAGTRS